MRLVVAIDAGGTSTRILAADDAGATRGALRGGSGASGPSAPGADLEAALREWLAAARAAVIAADEVAVIAGVAGAGRPAGVRRARRALRRAFTGVGLAPPPMDIRTDAEIALWSASPVAQDAASVLLAGTGAIAMAQDASGRTARCGGYGRFLDDAGGGFWIGAQALSAVPPAVDGRRPAAAALAAAALSALDIPDLDALVEAAPRLWGHPSQVAALAPRVCALAVAGDLEASRIIDAGGRALADLAVAVRRTLGLTADAPLAYGGGLLNSEPSGVLVQALRRHLPADLAASARRMSVPPVVGTVCRWLRRVSGESAAEHLLADRARWEDALR